MSKSSKKALALAVLCAVSSMNMVNYASAEEAVEAESQPQVAQLETAAGEEVQTKGTSDAESPVFALDTMLVEG